MKLLACGDGVQVSNWKVEESKAVGHCRIYWIDDGEIWYDDEHGTQKLLKNWLYFFPSVKPYAVHHDPNKPITCLWLHIDLQPSVILDLVPVEVIQGGSFCHLLESIRQCIKEGGQDHPSFHSMVQTMLDYCHDRAWLPQPCGKIPEILAYLNSNYNQEVSIEQISSHFHYTPEHFIRLFQRELNLTPYQYLIQCRMREAERLLLAEVPVNEVARQVGYGDAKVFAHRFKQIFGVAPSLYKKYYHPMA